MDPQHAREIAANPKFQELSARRGKLAWRLTWAMLVVYYAFIVVIAFWPALLALPIAPGATTTIGIPLGLGVIIFTFVITGIYVHKANTEFDRLTKEIVEEHGP